MALPLYDDSRLPIVPWATWVLIALNVTVFLFLQPSLYQSGVLDGLVTPGFDAELADDLAEVERYSFRYSAIPCELDELRSVADGADCDGLGARARRGLAGADLLPQDKSVPLSLLSSMFSHGFVAHLVFNMAFLWVFGRSVEARLGRVGFVALYLLAGLAGTYTFALLHVDEFVALVGASGAISGVMGAYVVVNARSRIATLVPGVVTQLVYVPALVVVGLYFIGQFATPDDAVNQVAWEAHVGGMVAGAVLALPFVLTGRVRRLGGVAPTPF